MNASGFSGGGSLSMTEAVTLVYCIGLRGEHFWLEGAVLLRSKRPWPPATAPVLPRSKPPPFVGSASRVGRHYIVIDQVARVVRISESLQLPLNEFNVVMLDLADHPVDLPIVYEMLTIGADLGAAPSTDGFQLSLAMQDVVQQLSRSLEESARVRAFLNS
jgi:hypothetical protein